MDISKTNSEEPNKELEIVKIGGKNLAAVFLTLTEEEKKAGLINGKDNIVSFTPRELFVLRTFLKVLNFEETAKETNIKVGSVKRMLCRENLKRYLKDRIMKAAIKAGTDKDWLVMTLRNVAEGITTPDDTQMKALKYISDIIAPKGPGVVVNQNNQTTFYSDLDQGQLDAEILNAETTAAL